MDYITERLLMGAGGSDAYWLNVISAPAGGTLSFADVAVDGSDNAVAVGTSAGATKDALVVKYSPVGAVLWQRSFGRTAVGDDFGNGVAIDSANGIYLVVTQANAASLNQRGVAAIKLDSSGTLQWSFQYASASAVGNACALVAGRLVIAGSTTNAGANRDIPFAILVDPATGGIPVGAGGALPQYSLDPLAASAGEFTDVSGNTGEVFSVGYFSGTIVAARCITPGSFPTLSWAWSNSDFAAHILAGLALSGGNLFMVGTADSGLCLLNVQASNGSILWRRTLSAAGWSVSGGSVAVDSSSNVYVAGVRAQNVSPLARYGIIAKYDSSGTLQWQRQLRHLASNGQVTISSIALGSREDLVVAGFITAEIGSLGSDFSSGWTANAVTITANAATAPDGSLTATAINETTATDEHRLRRVITGLSANSVYTFSIYVKNLSGRDCEIRILDSNNTANGFFAKYLLTTGTVSGGGATLLGTASSSATATVTTEANGWYRVTLSGNTGSVLASSAIIADVFVSNSAAGSASYAGSTSQGILVWGAQLDIGATASAYGMEVNRGFVMRLPSDGSLTGTYGSYAYESAAMTGGSTALSGVTSVAAGSTSATSTFGALNAGTPTLTTSLTVL